MSSPSPNAIADVSDQLLADANFLRNVLVNMALRPEKKNTSHVMVGNLRLRMFLQIFSAREFLKIFLCRCNSEIGTTIIKRVAVYVINHDVRHCDCIGNQPVHHDPYSSVTKVVTLWRSAARISIFAAASAFHDVPIAARQNRQKVVVNDNLPASDLKFACHVAV